MRKDSVPLPGTIGGQTSVPLTWVHTLVIGSGAAGLNAAVQLRANGVEDVLVVTDGLQLGTSINTGSDKQTYYKLSMYGEDADAPRAMAKAYFAGGSMHGDLALVEASLSARAFVHLVNLGVQFPRDKYGQFVGYKTDHDPRQRATSVGPHTSREICRALIGRVAQLNVPVREGRNVVQLLTFGAGGKPRVAGAIALAQGAGLEAYGAENVVFAVGGPGGLYTTSVYPEVHTGAIGLALMAGAKAQNLPESQYGLASIDPRWNVSGSYMQVVPRFLSTAADGTSDQREFLLDYFDPPPTLHSTVFLKGYQWPFDARRAVGGSSLIDVLVFVETVLNGRRVFLDFRRDPEGFALEALSPEAREYLVKSGAVQSTPIERLRHMNPAALDVYADHGVEIAEVPIEIAVCAQHNNGGLAANHWWESTNVRHLFPVGEVNGSHGVTRPGGAALNAGQAGGFRAAEYIANRYCGWTLSEEAVRRCASKEASRLVAWIARCRDAPSAWRSERAELQERMTTCAAHVRSLETLGAAVPAAWRQWRRIEARGCRYEGAEGLAEALRNRHLCFAHAVYLEAIRYALQSGVGSRGSAMVLDPAGARVHETLGEAWRIAAEDTGFRESVLETVVQPDGSMHSAWVPRRPIPVADAWFETAWASFRSGQIYE